MRRFSSGDEAERIDPGRLPYPTYWFRPPQRVPTEPGHHRVAWDLRYTPPRGATREFSIAAIYRNTPSGPNGPFVHPGRYTVRLTVDGQVVERPIDVRIDPRVTVAAADLQIADRPLARVLSRATTQAQDLREAIDAALAPPADASTATRRAVLEALRGPGSPGDPDVLYGSITAVPGDVETVVGLAGEVPVRAEPAPGGGCAAHHAGTAPRCRRCSRRWHHSSNGGSRRGSRHGNRAGA